MANPMRDGEVREVWGSGSKPYQLKCIGQVHSCSCPAWRNQSLAIDKRTCSGPGCDQGTEGAAK